MWKLILAIFVACSFLACEPECDDCEECDTGMSDIQAAIVAAAESGEIVEIDGAGGEVELNGAFGFIPTVKSQALATCPAFGLPSPEYDWFCVESNENGRVVARDEAEPTLDSFQVYDEYPSVAYPDPMTSKLYFSKDIYPNHWGGPWQAMRGQIQAWSAAWGNARVDWCNHPVHGERCNQE